MPGLRKDRVGEHRTALEKNKRIIFQTQNICGICGLPVDMSLKYPDPMSKTVDHIIPIAKGGHPSDLDNLQLAHRCCNRQKSDRLFLFTAEQKNPGGNEKSTDHENTGSRNNQTTDKPEINGNSEIDNDDLPLHVNWSECAW